MGKAHDSKLLLQKYIKRLHAVSGQFNLYINSNGSAEMSRMKQEAEKIKQLTLLIEREIEKIEISNSIR